MNFLIQRLLAMVLFFVSANAVFAKNEAELFEQANKLYKAGQYELAVAEYDKIVGTQTATADVFYNLGNAHFKSGALGKAILNYERALRLSPDDEDVQHNLQLANLKTTDRIEAVPQLALVKGWNSFVESQSAKGWLLLAAVAAWLALLFFVAYLFVSGLQRVGMVGGVLVLLISFSLLLLSFVKRSRENASGYAILTSANAYVKSAPEQSSQDLFILHEGVKMKVLDQVSGWCKVRLADGKVGWVTVNAIGII